MSDFSSADESVMLDAAGVAGALRRWVPLGATIARSWATERRIIGVVRKGTTTYPAWQFDQAGLPVAAMRDIIMALRRACDAEDMLSWLHAPSEALGGHRPCERLRDDPRAVIAAARQVAMMQLDYSHAV